MKYLVELDVDEFNFFMGEMGYYDNMIFWAESIDEHFESPYDALRSAHFGSFSPYYDFFTYNGSGNIVSIHEHDLDDYMEDYESDIIRLLESMGELEEYINFDNLERPVKNETIKKYLMEIEEE